MFRLCGVRRLQVGVHVPHGTTVAAGASMKNWPKQQIPQNFNMLQEQRRKGRMFPRDVGRVPRDFVLRVLFTEQPVPVEDLWSACNSDSECVLEGKNHLRQILKQCRDEGFLVFEKQSVDINGMCVGQQVSRQYKRSNETVEKWCCVLTRERYADCQEIASMSQQNTESNASAEDLGLQGDAAVSTDSSRQEAMDTLSSSGGAGFSSAKHHHVQQLLKAISMTKTPLRKYERYTIDYLPYTDANGRVSTMWWYETEEKKDAEMMLEPSSSSSSGDPNKGVTGQNEKAEKIEG